MAAAKKRRPTKAEQEQMATVDRQTHQTEATKRVAHATQQVANAQHRVAGLIEALIGELQAVTPALPKVPTRYTQLVQALTAGATTIAALFLTQGLIDNRTEKLVTGGAAVLIPLAVVVGVWVSQAIHQTAQARVNAAHVTARLDSTVAAIKTAQSTSFRASVALSDAATQHTIGQAVGELRPAASPAKS